MKSSFWNPAQHYKAESVATEYDSSRFSSVAGRTFNYLEKRLIVRAFADIPRGSVIADIPCGTGRLAEALLDDGHTVLGMDISPAMISVAQKRLSRFGDRFQTRVCDVRELTEAKPQFEAVLCARVLMLLPPDEQIVFLRNVAALARSRVVFTQGITTALHRARRTLKRRLGQTSAPYPVSPTELAKLMAAARLTETSRRSVLPIVSESRIFVAKVASSCTSGGPP